MGQPGYPLCFFSDCRGGGVTQSKLGRSLREMIEGLGVIMVRKEEKEERTKPW